MKRPIYILNGPPNSGKDTIAEAFEDVLEHHRFKTVLYKLTAERFGISLDTLISMATDRNLKDKPSNLLLNVSPRDALIYTSERCIKPNYGKDFFGKALAQTIDASDASGFIVSDGGFEEELTELKKVGRVIVIRLYRPGCSFEGDSRSYFKDYHYCIYNDGSIEEMIEKMRKILSTSFFEGEKNGKA